jgi:hypothetical protein
MVDGISSQWASYTPASVPAPSVAPPTVSTPGQAPAPGFPAFAVSGVASAPGFTPQPAPSLASAAAPSFVPDFSIGGAASFVLDWRDPTTKQVLVQVPMRTALASFAGADKTDAMVGQQVNTKV